MSAFTGILEVLTGIALIVVPAPVEIITLPESLPVDALLDLAGLGLIGLGMHTIDNSGEKK